MLTTANDYVNGYSNDHVDGYANDYVNDYANGYINDSRLRQTTTSTSNVNDQHTRLLNKKKWWRC